MKRSTKCTDSCCNIRSGIGVCPQALKLAQARLGTDPLGRSESREDQNRVCFLKPLTIYFTLDFEDDTVEITQVFFSLKS